MTNDIKKLLDERKCGMTKEELKKAWTPRVSKGLLHNVYENALDISREVALEHGYAVGVHGSETRDLDLIAVPWIETCSSSQDLADAIAKKLGWWIHSDIAKKPHGRTAYTIYYYDHAHIDLSVVPAIAEMQAEIERLREALKLSREGHAQVIRNSSDILAKKNSTHFMSMCDEVLENKDAKG